MTQDKLDAFAKTIVYNPPKRSVTTTKDVSPLFHPIKCNMPPLPFSILQKTPPQHTAAQGYEALELGGYHTSCVIPARETSADALLRVAVDARAHDGALGLVAAERDDAADHRRGLVHAGALERVAGLGAVGVQHRGDFGGAFGQRYRSLVGGGGGGERDGDAGQQEDGRQGLGVDGDELHVGFILCSL